MALMSILTHSNIDLNVLFAGKDLGKVGVIQANVNDNQSLVKMCEQGTILLNCVGPVCYNIFIYLHCFNSL